MISFLRSKTIFPSIQRKLIINYKNNTFTTPVTNRKLKLVIDKEIKFVDKTNDTDTVDKKLLNQDSDGDKIYSTYSLNRLKNENVYEYFSQDEELEAHDDPNENLDSDKLNFVKFDVNEMTKHMLRKDLNERGSKYIISLAEEIVNRYVYQLSLENNKKEHKKLYVPKEERKSVISLKLKKDIDKLNYNFINQIENVYVHHETRIKLKEKFYFNDEFWNSLLGVKNEKIIGKNLENFVKILEKTMCQKLVLWDKFIECFRLNLNEMADKKIFYKPCRVEKLFEIIEYFNDALDSCKGINMSVNVFSGILEKNQKLISGLITDYRDFTHFEVLTVYKQFCPKLDNSNMEKAACIKLELNGEYLDLNKLCIILGTYDNYYKDSDHKEFSILENLFIETVKTTKIISAQKFEDTNKKLKLNNRKETNEVKAANEKINNYYIFEAELVVLKNFAKGDLWFPYKFINSFIQNLLELDYQNDIVLVVEFSQLFAKFSYYDPDHFKKLTKALHSLNFSEIRFPFLFDIFILAISDKKIDKLFLDNSYENLVATIRPYMDVNTPSHFKKPLLDKEIEIIYMKMTEYYNTTLILKKNSHFKVNEKLFEELLNMVFHLYNNNLVKNYISSDLINYSLF